MLHNGPVQELSAASLRLQLVEARLDDGRTKAEMAVIIGSIRRAVAQLSEIGARFDGT
jgi:hypothetical protein